MPMVRILNSSYIGNIIAGQTIDVGFPIKYVMLEDGPDNGKPHIHLYSNGTYSHASYNCCEYLMWGISVNGSRITCTCSGGTIVVVG